MNFNGNELGNCILKATELAEHYMQIALAADSPERSVDWLKDLCRQYCGKTINLLELEIDKDHTTICGACIHRLYPNL